METPLRSEHALLLACAGTNCGIERRDAIRRGVAECSNWDYLLETARRHGVTALVSVNLDRAAGDLVPDEPLRILRERFRANAGRNLFLTQELLGIVRELGARGIDVIPFKGPIQAITAYGNVALREFLDLDLLVPKRHFDRARDALVQRGYRQPANQTDEREAKHIESQLGCDFFREEGRISVELHWSFLQKWLGFGVDLDSVWSAPGSVNVGGLRVLTLAAEISLLYLCAHGAKHRWSRLCWVVDVAEILRSQPELDWPALVKTAERMGCRRTLFLGLHLAAGLLEVKIPESIRAKMEHDSQATALARRIIGEMFSPLHERNSLEKDWFHIRTKERWRDQLCYVRYLAGWFLAPSQRDKQWILLPSYLKWLYFFLRPVRVACDLIHLRSRNCG